MRVLLRQMESLGEINIDCRAGKISGAAPLGEISGRNFSDTALWVRRDVIDESLEDIETLTKLFWRDEAVRRTGVFTMSLLYPRELRQAAKQAAEDPDIGEGITRDQAVEGLVEIMPDSLEHPVEAEVKGLGQFYNKIGICLSYPEFEAERQRLTDGMDEMLGIRYDWLEVIPHVSIARGNMDGLSNLGELEICLPPTIQLSPAQKLED